MITTNQIHWVAGILEGEGWFGNNQQGVPRLKVSMTDEDTVTKFGKIVSPKSTIHEDGAKLDTGRKLLFSTLAYGSNAIGWMMTIYPLMSNRRKEKIRKIIKVWKESNYSTRDQIGKLSKNPETNIVNILMKSGYSREIAKEMLSRMKGVMS